MSKDLSYLKAWPEMPYPRPIILECERSKSGMSMSVYDRDEKIITIGGCGFDRIGCAIARLLESVWGEELQANSDKLGGMYGARIVEGNVSLEGMTGYNCMIDIGKVIGLDIRVFDSRHGSIIHITKA